MRHLDDGSLEPEVPGADFSGIKLRIISFGGDVEAMRPGASGSCRKH